MNTVIQQLMRHRSIREFNHRPIAEPLLQDILRAGQAAASSSFLQGVTIIRITRPDFRQRLAKIAGNQKYVISAPEFLVFCADLRRSSDCCAMNGAEAIEGFTEQFIIATVDVALLAQNVVVAAESEGLGICYIGALRNDPQTVTELLELPRLVYPVFGLCLGYPAQDPKVKPRLPLSIVLKNDRYSQNSDAERISEYDESMREYYRTRGSNHKSTSWSEQMSTLLGKESRPHMREFLRGQGFEMK